MRTILAPILLATTAAASQELQYGNHIFNAIHSSMRQWGSSLNHNGMSAFIATVPAGTEFYHGTSSQYRINGTEWLAFEPEHALIFARGHRGGQPGRGGRPPGPPPREADEEYLSGHGWFSWGGDDSKPPRRRHGKPGEHRGPQSEPLHDKEVPRKHYGLEDWLETHHVPPGESGPPGEHHGFNDKASGPYGPGDDRESTRKDYGSHRYPPHGREPPPKGHNPKNKSEECHGALSGKLHDRVPSREHHDPKDNKDEHRELHANLKRDGRQGRSSGSAGPQTPLATHKTDNETKDSHGYLHTYVTKHALRLLYLDGQSAAKSAKGTLDTQDVVILQLDPTKLEEKDDQPHHGPMGEYERASGMCKMARDDWHENIDGILRMEGGFEIILCSFEKDLYVKNIVQTKVDERKGGLGGPPGAGMNYYRAVAARYDGIGGDRVQIDYDDFVTLFERPRTIYFDDTGRPRARNTSKELDEVRANIGNMARERNGDRQSVNWQAIADMVVARYADRIEYLATGKFDTLEVFQFEIDTALKPFVDYSDRNATLEVDRCATQFLPTTSNSTTLAARAFQRVTTELCSTLSSISSTLAISPSSTSLTAAQLQLRELKIWLGWTTWKKCRGCKVDEVCFLPIWPQGSEEDFQQPKCRSSVLEARGGYWGAFGGGGRGRGGNAEGKAGKSREEGRVWNSPRPH